MKKLKNGFKNFFKSLWDDFVNFVKHHWLRFIGFLCCFIIPFVTLLAVYVRKVENATKYTIPFAVILPLFILIVLWYSKAKSYFKEKLSAMKIQNSIEAGKHAGLIIVFETIKALMTILPFALCYIIVNELQKYYMEVSKIFLFLTICEAVGGFFCILDTIINVSDFN